jgi:transcriptional regulator with XRE-family HTH domain
VGASQLAESFRGLVLRHRGRTGLTQRDMAGRVGVSRRTLQDWERGLAYPIPERLKSLITVLLDAGGLTVGREAADARVLWSAAPREAPRTHPPFDEEWFANLLAARAPPAPRAAELEPVPGMAPAPHLVERREDWGEAPDTTGFVGRVDELALLRRWILEEHCRLVAVLGVGGVGKTSLAAKLIQEVAPSFERVYWRSLRDAPPPAEWLAGAIGFLSDQQLVPPAGESERIASLLQLLRHAPCLVVLDNSETLFEPGQQLRSGWDGAALVPHRWCYT